MTTEAPGFSSFSRAHRRWPGLAFLLFALVPLACVNLSKPSNVEGCAKNSTCSDDPSKLPGPEPGPDAAAVLPDGPLMPDMATPDTAPDLASDPPTSSPDKPVVPDLLAETMVAPDTRNDSITDGIVVVDDGGSDQADADAGADDRPLGPETLAELGPEHGPELGPELGPEPGPEPGPELGRETVPEPVPEPIPEPTPEPGRDGGDSSPGNCITQLISNGYAAGTAPPCNVCKENGNSLTAKCTEMIDCLAPPKTQADITNCQNAVGGDSTVYGCVYALTTAACPTGF